VFAYEFFRIVLQVFEQGNEGGVARVSYGHTDITQKPTVFDAFKGRTTKALFKCCWGETGQFLKGRVYLFWLGL
jgi:hypothetical protein